MIEEENQQITPEPNQPSQTGQEGGLSELLRFVVTAVIIIALIRIFIAQPFIVSGASMEPTFDDGEYLIVDELSYYLRPPERGEVIIFRYPRDPSKFFIKRVIGLPGETIVIEDGRVIIKNQENPEGLRLDEPYVEILGNSRQERTLAPDEYFVLGDNRSASSDSRSWGPVGQELIIGRAFVRLYPLNDLSILPGDYSQ